MSWQPTASFEALALRARLLEQTRAFFRDREVLEVETPQLSTAGTTEVHLHSFCAAPATPSGGRGEPARWLQTSPELAMKRLLAAGSGSIYQFARCFRAGEAGSRHNPEFTLLEWYRPGWDHHELMVEVVALLETLLPERLTEPAETSSYRTLFADHLGVDPATESIAVLRERARRHLGPSEDASASLDRDDLLGLLLTHEIEARLPGDRVTLVTDFPASQASLARIVGTGEEAVAERFEAFIGPIELANGFHELLDGGEQRRRFDADLEIRRQMGLSEPPIDERFLAALDAGLPPCAGVALGFDRLAMLATGAHSIEEVLAFPWDRA